MNTEISIVTGTYNRLEFLKRMIQSAKDSMGVGIPYEFVIVDGGSTDGTIKWCQTQNDIVLIQQGKLLGAVKAFNEGAYKSKGKYVILANDDITFIGQGIARSLAYMQEHPSCAIGCFAQDRDGRPFYVDHIPAIGDNGQSLSLPYGQVCIVQKHIGDALGWWGDYLYTYAGDNELSCRVWETGYTVDEIDGCRIHDLKVSDDLRKVNDPNPGHNKDSHDWVAKWTNADGRRGPIVGSKPQKFAEISSKPRLLYAPIYEPGFAIQKTTKHGLRDALSKYFTVCEVDYYKKSGLMYDFIHAFNPHVCLLQMQDASAMNRKNLDMLKKSHPKCIFVNWNGDYLKHNLLQEDYINLIGGFDLALFVHRNLFDLYSSKGAKCAYWQIGYERYDKPDPADVSYDILFLGNGYSERRISLGKFLRSVPYKVGIYGSWRDVIKVDGHNQYDFVAGDALMQSSKIVIGDCQYREASGYVSNRLFQSMYAGSFVLQETITDMTETIGLVDGKHLVTWSSLDDLGRKLKYWLHPDRDAERRRISEEGRKFVTINHSFERRAQEFVKLLTSLNK